MENNKIFADANSHYKDSKYIICGVPFDQTSCFRKGSRFAPREIRNNSYNFESYNHIYDIELKDVNINDAGDLDVSDNIDETLDIISVYADKYVNDGKIPIMLGGEHSLTLPFIKACKNKYKDITCVVLDAHLDLRNEYDGEKNSHACISRNIIDHVTKNYMSIGTRSGSREEYDYIKDNKIITFSADDIFLTGICRIVDKIEIYNDPVYLSIDMDVIDPGYAPAVGTPEPYGLTPRDIRYIITHLAHYVVGFDMVEITPQYDYGNTALLGAKLVRDFIAAKAKSDHKY